MPDQVPFGDLRRQYLAHRNAIDSAVSRVLASGWYVLGEEGRLFETEWSAWSDLGEVVGCANGTDAIKLSLMASGVRAGDDVVVPALTAMPTATAVVDLGARPIFADVDPRTGLVTEQTVAAVFTPKTRAIIVVHLYGQCCELTPLRRLADERQVALIEDAAQAHGARDGDRRVGWAGDFTTFSFYPSKNLGAFGDGGALSARNPDAAACARTLRDYGQTGRYEHTTFGINSRLDEIQAAILRAKLPSLGPWNDRRRAIARRYDEAIGDREGCRPIENRQGEGHVRHLYPVLCADKTSFQREMATKGIATSVHYPRALPEQPSLPHAIGQWAEASKLAASIVTLPIFPELTDDEVQRVCDALRIVGRSDR